MKRAKEIDEFIAAMYTEDPKEVILVPGMESAFIGIATLPTDSSVTVAVYNRDKCIDLLAKDMSQEEAAEHFERNVEGSYVGKVGPIFIIPFQ